MPYHASTIERCGIEIEMDVSFRITHGSVPASWDDPGDAMEIEIDRIITIEAGLLMFGWRDGRLVDDLSDDEIERIVVEIQEKSLDYEDDY